MDDHGYASKAQVEFGQRPARPQMQSGSQRQMQDTGYYGEESRHDSYYGGSGGSANVGSGYTPTTDMSGKIGDDGYEWLEFPERVIDGGGEKETEILGLHGSEVILITDTEEYDLIDNYKELEIV